MMTGGYGWKARIGQLYPAGGLADGEPQAMAPEGVLFVTTRIGFARVGLTHARGLVDDLETPARLLNDAAVQMVLFNCTSASMDVGPEVINRRIEAAAGVPSTTTIEGVMAALHAVKAKRIGLLTPYTPDVIEAETRFLARHGITVAMTGGEPCTTPVEQGLLPPARWIEWAKPFAGKGLDALLVSCAGIRIALVLQEIEDKIGVPVITSNQAVVWQCLRKLGLPDRPKGFGALLAGQYD
jgi:maleate isomerase